MKIQSIISGRVSLVFIPDEVNPINGVYLPEFIRLITERYGFPLIPATPIAGQNTGGVTFKDGRMIAGSAKVNVLSLTIYNNAIAVDTSHTDSSKLVIEDFTNWAVHTFGFRKPQKEFFTYENTMVVDFDTSLDKMISIFSHLTKAASSAMEKTYRASFPLDLHQIGFALDPTNAPDGMLKYVKTNFNMTRRVGDISYSTNRYFCEAPLQTEDHIVFLQDFEKMISAADLI